MPSQIDELDREIRDLLHRKADGLEPPDGRLEQTLRRSNRRLARNAVVGLLVVGLLGSGAAVGIRSLAGPASTKPANRSLSPGAPLHANGAFVIAKHDGIYEVKRDGSGLRKIVDCPVQDCDSVATPAWSPDGSKIAFAALPREGSFDLEGLFVVAADGSGLDRLTECAPPGCTTDWFPTWSPDGSRIAFSRLGGHQSQGTVELYRVNPDGSGLRRLADLPGYAETPAWSPDGARIAFALQREDGWRIEAVDADGSHLSAISREPGDGPEAPSWSPDGSKIAFDMNSADGNPDIFVMNSDGSHVRRLTSDPQPDLGPIWSPDGSKIAFIRTGSGGDLFVMDASGGEPELVVNDVLGASWQALPEG
jgi:Tol biopolymer transport system component